MPRRTTPGDAKQIQQPTHQSRARSGRSERFRTIVVGGGAAGLVMGYYLRRAGEPFLIVEADPRVGDTWRRHYDSLRLFSRPRYASLPGLRIGTRDCPTAAEMADYLERYADHFDLPVRAGEQVTRLTCHGDAFTLRTDRREYLADRVVVAAGAHRRPIIPAIATTLDPQVRQLHSLEYRRPDQLAAGEVLVIGAGNSGTDIALEAAATGHRTWLAGRHPGQIPVELDSPAGRIGTPVMMFMFKHVFTQRTPMGRAMRDRDRDHGEPLVRNKLAHLDAAGINRVGRIVEVRDGRPVTDDGLVLDVATVVWCTGSRPDHGWLDLPVFDDAGRPRQDRGVSTDVPGLCFLGLEFQFAAASGTIQGLDRDARYLLRRLRTQADVGNVTPVPLRRAA